MIALVFLIPILACVLLLVFFREWVRPLEYLLVLIPGILVPVIVYISIKSYVSSDTEYLGYYTTQVAYYEPWNEYIHKTCTREVYDGRDEDGNAKYHTETYDCSYVKEHREYWEMILSNGRTLEISQREYDEIVCRFGTPKVFVDMHRHYYTKDGDKYTCSFSGDRNHMYTVTLTHRYKNKVKNSMSIFNFSEVGEDKADSLGLYDYPPVVRNQNPIVGYNPGESVIDSFKYVNAYYGSPYQFRCFVFVYRNKPMSIVEEQKNFLIGGNKNELIVCISIDETDNVQWVNSFSWEDTPYMSVGCNHIYEEGETLDLMVLERYLLENVPKQWKRKEFADFDYIETPVTSTGWFFVVLSSIITCIIMSVVVVLNEI